MGIFIDDPNFEYLAKMPEFRSFAQPCIDAENAFKTSPTNCVKSCRAALEAAVNWVYAHDKTMKIDDKLKGAKNPNGKPVGRLFKMMESTRFKKSIGPELSTNLHYIRMLGNEALHPGEKTDESWRATPQEATDCLKHLFEFVQWIGRRYLKETTNRTFDKDEIPTEPSTLTTVLKYIGATGAGAAALLLWLAKKK